MRNNNSPKPTFETDVDRTFFIATLPINKFFLNHEAHETVSMVEGVVEGVVESVVEIINLIKKIHLLHK